METKELQNKANEIVNLIDRKLGTNHDSENTISHLVEEIGELTLQLNNPKLRNKQMDIKNINEEIADVSILAMRLATLYNIDIEEAITTKIQELKKRHNLEV